MTSTYTVDRSITIDAPPPFVYEQIADFHAWTDWSPWEAYDPDMTRTYSGPEVGPGSGYAWSGNSKAGRGRMTIVDATKPSQVHIDLLFEKPFRSRNEIRFTIAPEGAGSRVTWTMTGPRTLATRVMSIVKSMDAMIGPDFERGLSKLKATTEARAAR
jgi:hypothetical protein